MSRLCIVTTSGSSSSPPAIVAQTGVEIHLVEIKAYFLFALIARMTKLAAIYSEGERD